MNRKRSGNGRIQRSFASSSRKINFTQMNNVAPSTANDLVSLFLKIGLTDEKAKETANNKKIAPLLEKAILHVRYDIDEYMT